MYFKRLSMIDLKLHNGNEITSAFSDILWYCILIHTKIAGHHIRKCENREIVRVTFRLLHRHVVIKGPFPIIHA